MPKENALITQESTEVVLRKATNIMNVTNKILKNSKKSLVANPDVMMINGLMWQYGSDEINDKELLRKKSEILREKIDNINKEIEALLQSDIYMTIKETDDLDAYFDALKESLVAEKEALVLELKV